MEHLQGEVDSSFEVPDAGVEFEREPARVPTTAFVRWVGTAVRRFPEKKRPKTSASAAVYGPSASIGSIGAAWGRLRATATSSSRSKVPSAWRDRIRSTGRSRAVLCGHRRRAPPQRRST